MCKGDIQNVQSSGSRGPGLKTTTIRPSVAVRVICCLRKSIHCFRGISYPLTKLHTPKTDVWRKKETEAISLIRRKKKTRTYSWFSNLTVRFKKHALFLITCTSCTCTAMKIFLAFSGYSLNEIRPHSYKAFRHNYVMFQSPCAMDSRFTDIMSLRWHTVCVKLNPHFSITSVWNHNSGLREHRPSLQNTVLINFTAAFWHSAGNEKEVATNLNADKTMSD